jgi:hypothetical protein
MRTSFVVTDIADKMHVINVSNEFLPGSAKDNEQLVYNIAVSRQIRPLRIERAQSVHDVDEAVISSGSQHIEYQSVPSHGDVASSMIRASLSRELLHERQWG